jgi:transaldolase
MERFRLDATVDLFDKPWRGGATCNPVIVLGVLKNELGTWKGRIQSLIRDLPDATEDEIAWRVVREISVPAAALLKPIFDQQRGKNRRLSIQTDPRSS